MTLVTVKPSDMAARLIVAPATPSKPSKPFYTSNTLDHPLAAAPKQPRGKIELLTRERALGKIVPSVFEKLCRSFAKSPKAESEIKEMLSSKELSVRQDGFVLFAAQQTNPFILAHNASLTAAPKRRLKKPGSASKRAGHILVGLTGTERELKAAELRATRLSKKVIVPAAKKAAKQPKDKSKGSK